VRAYYGNAYYEWQRSAGSFSAMVDMFKFQPYIAPDDRLIDFGCGGGFLLNNIVCRDKVGVEPNPAARRDAESLGLRVYGAVEDLPDRFATMVISHHALEHVEAPLEALRSLLPKMQTGAKAVFVVPHESPRSLYDPNNIDQHLYTWSPRTLGNLFKAAGYCNISVRSIRHMWPPRHRRLYEAIGPTAFHLACRIYAILGANYQLCAFARKP
jgi:SAM-dependent methyltransferase